MMSANAKTAVRLAFSLLVVLLQNVLQAVFTAGIVVFTFAFGVVAFVILEPFDLGMALLPCLYCRA